MALLKDDWLEAVDPTVCAHLLPVLGKRLLIEIEARDIAKHQETRFAEGASNQTINIEVGILRQIMRKSGTWARIEPDVPTLSERQDCGHALSAEEERTLLYECAQSRSRILLPFVVLALETGARFNTIRTLSGRCSVRASDWGIAAPKFQRLQGTRV